MNSLKKVYENEYRKSIEKFYSCVLGKELNLNSPETFNEKISWMKIYDNREIKTFLSDKYLVREYIKKKIGDKYLLKLFGQYTNVDEIDFGDLPNKFAIKTNHGCNYNIIVKNKKTLNIKNAKNKLKMWMMENYAHKGGEELQYEKIFPKIIIEEFCDSLLEYQFWCFNGKPEFVSVIDEPHGKNEKITYDMDWKKLPFVTSLPRMKKKELEKPETFDEMKTISRKLCKGLKFVRVDLIVSKENEIKFSEMTFTPASGTVRWNPEEYDLYWGRKLKIGRKKFNL